MSLLVKRLADWTDKESVTYFILYKDNHYNNNDTPIKVREEHDLWIGKNEKILFVNNDNEDYEFEFKQGKWDENIMQQPAFDIQIIYQNGKKNKEYIKLGKELKIKIPAQSHFYIKAIY